MWLKGRSDVIVCLQIHSRHTACSLKCLLAQASAGHENPKEAKESGMKFVGWEICTWDQRVAYRLGKLSNAEISDFSASRRVSRVEPPISSTFDKLGEGSAGEGTLARW